MRISSFFFLCLLASAHLFGADVSNALENIPQDEKDKMASFFDYAIKLGHAGHVLYFQNKPACLIGMSFDAECDSKFREGWLTFKKNENLFSNKGFVFDELTKSFPSSKVIHVYLINKKTVASCIKNHSEIFHKILGREVNGTKFLRELENGEHLTDLINNNEVLLGILLGYGEESSKLYSKNRLLSEEQKELDKSYVGISTRKMDDIEIYPVAFMGSSNSQEAARINAQFQEERKSLWEIYLKKNKDSTLFFLEALCK